MILHTGSFRTLENKKENLSIHSLTKLTGEEALAIRKEISGCQLAEYDSVYIDAKDVTCADLSGINEIIHTHYTLAKANRKLVFIYRRSSSVEKWVETTGLDNFVETAIIPSN